MPDAGWTVAPNAWLTAVILVYVTAQRLVELRIAKANTRRLKREGAFEVGASHYPLIVALHAFWLAVVWIGAFGEFVHLSALLLFALAQVLRLWTLASIGRRWTTRILVKHGEELVTRGPYRFLAHPNYVVVVLEIALLPAIFGLYAIAILFSLLNAAILVVRLRAEAEALRAFTRGRSHASATQAHAEKVDRR